MSKMLKGLVYLISLLIAGLSIFYFTVYTARAGKVYEDIGDISGIVLLCVMIFASLMFVMFKLMKLQFLPQPIKQYIIKAAKFFRSYHYAAGIFAASLVILHFTFAFDIAKPFKFDRITGYATGAIVLASIFIGIIYAIGKKRGKLHLWLFTAALVPLALHLLG